MDQNTETKVVGVRFSRVGKVYNFGTNNIQNIRIGDVVVVETSRGWQLGEVVAFQPESEKQPEGGLKSIDRLATPKDLIQRQSWQAKEPDVVDECKKRAQELKLHGIKIIMSEYSFNGSRLTIFFSTDTEEKVELRSLRSDMLKLFAPAQLEIRQIGPRDVAKYLGGMGACGLESRCCSKFITEFSSISIRMAKEQGISLTPSEVTGMCGRLRCCLIYEYDNYVEARKHLPKRNRRVVTPDGEGKVLDVFPIREGVLVELQDNNRREYQMSALTLMDEPESAEKKPARPNAGGGGCGLCNRQ